jgi:hypothetical protein
VIQHHLEWAERLEQTLRGFVAASRKNGPIQPPELPGVASGYLIPSRLCAERDKEGEIL